MLNGFPEFEAQESKRHSHASRFESIKLMDILLSVELVLVTLLS
jgi:hypothetical protein